MKKFFLISAFSILVSSVFAQKTHEDSVAMYQEAMQAYVDSVNQSFKYETGVITLDGGFAKINVPKGLKFLNAAQSKTVLVDLWGNPSADGVLGMLFPTKYTPLDSASWAFTVTFDGMGYVEDDDAEDMDYTELLGTMQKETLDENPERQKQGYEPITLVGWASTPFYDKERKVLHWAKEFKFGENEYNTLNYDVRVLGRKGVLSLNAVGKMTSLPEVKPAINYLLSSVEFEPGHKYSDFDPDLDNVAEVTVGGLVAGKIIAKVGLWAIIAKYANLIFIAIAAAFGGMWKWITGKRKKNNEVLENTNTDIVSKD